MGREGGGETTDYVGVGLTRIYLVYEFRMCYYGFIRTYLPMETMISYFF